MLEQQTQKNNDKMHRSCGGALFTLYKIARRSPVILTFGSSLAFEFWGGLVNLPRYLQLTDVAITMDGGTYSFSAIDENNVPHQICLIQHAFYPAIIDVAAIPGRLYFDRELIDIRSPSEQAVISLLTNACDSAEGSICSICRKMIGFVSSVDYLRCADRLEQMADLTRYDVWLSFENLDRRQAIVGLSRLRGVSVRIAREIIDNEHPIAQQLTAAAVADLFILYRSNGFDLKTKPPFLWCS